MGAQYISHDLNHVFDVVDVNVGSWELGVDRGYLFFNDPTRGGKTHE